MRNGHRGSSNYNQVSLHGSDSSDDEDDIVRQHMRSQELHLQKQDEGLEMLSQSAERLGKMSMTISDELGQQNKMLEEMDADLEMAGDNLDMVTRKTKELIQKAGGGRTFVTIIGLILVVVILVFLILYT